VHVSIETGVIILTIDGSKTLKEKEEEKELVEFSRDTVM
jgi:hypothetical protein